MTDEGRQRRWIGAELGPRDIAHYIADTLRELVPLANDAAFRDLAYLLKLALAEAEHFTGPPAPAKDG